MSKKTKGLIGLLAVLALIAGFVIPIYNNIAREQQEKREEEKRMEKLYQHGFRLLEEQIATYIVEHYSGVSKVEFSPIFKGGGDGYSMLTLNILPVIYDEYGNRAVVGGEIGDMDYGSEGLIGGISALELDSFGDEIIYLKRSAKGEEIDVSGKKNLPEEAKLSKDDGIDEIIEALIQKGKIRDVSKSENGSPEAEVTYNLEIRKGDITQWK